MTKINESFDSDQSQISNNSFGSLADGMLNSMFAFDNEVRTLVIEQIEEKAKAMAKEPIDPNLNIFTSVRKMNWSWVKKRLDELWTQFDCLNCMAIESLYQKWLKD